MASKSRIREEERRASMRISLFSTAEGAWPETRHFRSDFRCNFRFTNLHIARERLGAQSTSTPHVKSHDEGDRSRYMPLLSKAR